MLSKEQKDFINATLGITADELAQAISNEQEVALELPKGRFLTQDQEEKMLDLHGKRRYDAGISKMAKENFEGKTKEEYDNSLKALILEEAKLEPNEKLNQLTNTINSLKESLTEKDKVILSIQEEAENTKKRANALSVLPTLRSDLGINKSEALNIILGSVEQKEDGIYKDGKLIVNEHQEAVGLNDFLSQEVNSRGWVKKQIQGNGGKNGASQGATPNTYSSFQKHIESKGWKEGSMQANQYLESLQKSNPKFDLDN